MFFGCHKGAWPEPTAFRATVAKNRKSVHGLLTYNFNFAYVKMSYISIYRKYRPQSFGEIVGQDEIVKTLQNSIKSNRLSHAYIFCGPRGTGKTTTARIFAKAVNCLNNVDKNGKVITPEPCNECENCKDITSGVSVDLIEIDAASNTGIDNVRKLIENAQYLPNFLRKKIYIIDEIHNIGGGTTKAAFHALLKILEEPPENVIFILATTEPQKVIPTILSRCQRFDFKPIKITDIKERLKVISKAENIEVSDAALNLISKYSDGSQRDANVILEKIASLSSDKVRVEDIVSLLGAVDMEILFELTNILIESNSEEAAFFLNRLEKVHQNLEIFSEKFIEHLQNLYFIKNNPEGFDYISSGEEYKEKFLNQSRLLSNWQLNEIIIIFMDLLSKIKSGQPANILFKTGLIKALNLKTSKPEKEQEHDVADSSKITEINKEISMLKQTILELDERFDNFKNSFKDVLKIATNSQAHVIETAEKKPEEKNDIKKEKTDSFSKKAGHLKDMSSSEQKSDEGLSIIITKSDWEKILGSIKTRSISLNSLLSEVKKYNAEGNKIKFYLSDNYSWHKDRLNSPDNMFIIQNTLTSLFGKKFGVEFLLESQGKDLIDLRTAQKKIEADGDINEKRDEFEKFVEPSAEDDNVYDYIEEKFKIKEKKDGS